MANPEFVEKRLSPRFPVKIPLLYSQSQDEKVGGQTCDISSTGLCIISSRQLPRGAGVEVVLRIPDNGEEIFTKGTVVYSKGLEGGLFRTGVKLEDKPLRPVPLVLRTINSRLQY